MRAPRAIALYHARDLAEPGDGGWLARYDSPAAWPAGHVPSAARAATGTGVT